MTDIKSHIPKKGLVPGILDDEGPDAAAGLADADPALIELMELLFFAYRDFIGDPDAILDEIGFGRAHHRVLHFVNRHPGLRVADLLDILKITKQSLGRVLKQLIDNGYIAQEAGRTDRRERLLYPTDRGCALASRLAGPQFERLARAIDAAGPDGEDAVRRFLYHMISDLDRNRVSDLLNARHPGVKTDQETA
ncbi:MAG: MarR family winged helix-turn-helix transcriptional regulator [Methyloligellaceae bacterium]